MVEENEFKEKDGCEPSAPVNCSNAPIEPGMFLSDRCHFCGSYYDKIKPYICPDCWERIKEVIAKYRDELL